MRRSDQPRRPSATICRCVSWSKTLLMQRRNSASLAGVNVSARYSQWPVFSCPLMAGFECPPRPACRSAPSGPPGYGCAEGADRESGVENVWLDCTDTRLSRAVPAHQSALARPAARVRLAVDRAGCAALAGARPAGTRVDRDHGALRQSADGAAAGRPGKLESGKLFRAPMPGSGTEFHISFTTRPPGETVAPVTTIEDGRKLLRSQQVEDWLGGRDSNPDNVVQSHVSYR